MARFLIQYHAQVDPEYSIFSPPEVLLWEIKIQEMIVILYYLSIVNLQIIQAIAAVL